MLLHREMDAMSEEGGKALRKAVLDHMMTFMEVFTAKSNLNSRLTNLWTEIHTQLNTTKQELQAQIHRQLTEGDALFNISSQSNGCKDVADSQEINLRIVVVVFGNRGNSLGWLALDSKIYHWCSHVSSDCCCFWLRPCPDLQSTSCRHLYSMAATEQANMLVSICSFTVSLHRPGLHSLFMPVKVLTGCRPARFCICSSCVSLPWLA